MPWYPLSGEVFLRSNFEPRIRSRYPMTSRYLGSLSSWLKTWESEIQMLQSATSYAPETEHVQPVNLIS